MPSPAAPIDLARKRRSLFRVAAWGVATGIAGLAASVVLRTAKTER